MAEPTFDKDGYPTDETLLVIEEWPAVNMSGLMEFVLDAWNHHYGWFEESALEYSKLHGFEDGLTTFACATGGWSGNESIIHALGENNVFWLMCWRASARGGYYEFAVRMGADEPTN